MFRLGAFKKAEFTLGLVPIGALVLLSIVQSYIYSHVDTSECDLENFAADAAAAWEGYTLLPHTACYERLFKNEGNGDFARRYQQEFENLIADRHPRTGYKIGIHEPREQKMFGLDGPVFGVFYGENTWHPSGAILDVRGENLGFEPDFLLRIGDERANEATTIEEMANYIDRVYAFIELPAHLANPDEIHGAFLPNFYMMQALNLSARYGIIGDHIDTASDPNIVENLRTMTVVATDHNGVSAPIKYLADDETHVYITAIMAAQFLRERGERLEAGDLISVGAMGVFGGSGPDWDYPGIDTEMRHVHYYVGDQRLSVSVGFEDSVRETRHE